MASSNFVMTLTQNDVSGARGEAYLTVPKAARDEGGDFWGWPQMYTDRTDIDFRDVRVIDDGQEADRRIYWFRERSEFRIGTNVYRVGTLAEGGLLEVVKAPRLGVDFEYRVHLPGSIRHGLLAPRATQGPATANSQKVWGYF